MNDFGICRVKESESTTAQNHLSSVCHSVSSHRVARAKISALTQCPGESAFGSRPPESVETHRAERHTTNRTPNIP